MIGGDELYPRAAQRLALVLSGSLNTNKMTTAMGVAGVRLLASGGLQDDRGASQAAHTEVLTLLHGTWGDSSQPQLMPENGVIALPYGTEEGVDAGDGLLFRFNQPVKQVAVHDKADVDALLTVTPSDWAFDYQGVWVDETSLFIQILQYVAENRHYCSVLGSIYRFVLFAERTTTRRLSCVNQCELVPFLSLFGPLVA
jgi:hypothetical protein